MATKKKVARTPKQKAYDKRRAAKKAPVAKRAYNRKKHIETVDQNKDLPLVVGPIPSFDEMMNQANAAPAPSNEEILTAIEAIDMRDLPVPARFAVLTMLNDHGYLSANGKDFIEDTSLLMIGLQAPVLLLQHRNRLVNIANADALSGLQFISRPHVHVDATINFTYPYSSAPDEVVIGGQVYERKGAFPF